MMSSSVNRGKEQMKGVPETEKEDQRRVMNANPVTLHEFADALTALSDRITGVGSAEKAAFEEFLRSSFPAAAYDLPLPRKDAARLLHVFLYRVCGEADLDWGEAADLADVYDCRICANAIAQVCVRGILRPDRKGIFEGERFLSEAEAAEALSLLEERLRYIDAACDCRWECGRNPK